MRLPLLRRRPACAVLVGLLSVVLFAAGCGGDGATETSDTGAAESFAAETDTGSSDSSSTTVTGDLDSKPDVPLPDGDVSELGIEDLIVGEGKPAKVGDNVVVQYVGVLATDGTEFDASWDRGQPFEFPLGQGRVIPGWDQGVEGMLPGGRRVLTIPSDLAYGASGQGDIPADSDLVFVVDLISASSPADEVSALFDDGRERPTPPLPDGAVNELVTDDLIAGTGATANTGDLVNVHYLGVFADGVEFDASWDRGADPFQFVLGDGMVIEGWDDGVVGMQVGGRRALQIPFDQAYGAEGRPPSIPEAADLIFVVDLLKVTERTPAEDAPVIDLPAELTGDLETTDLIEGTGPEFSPGDNGDLHFVLMAYNTELVLETSYDRGFPVPVDVGVGALFPGFDEGLLGMKVGGRRLLVIPPDLAFGDDGVPPDIGPGETLVILADLVSIN